MIVNLSNMWTVSLWIISGIFQSFTENIKDVSMPFFTSNYPDLYERNSFVVSYIYGEPGFRLFVEIMNVQLCNDPNHYVIIFDGSNCFAPRIAVVQNSRPTKFVTSGNMFTTLLVSNSENQCSGISGRYKIIHQKKSPKFAHKNSKNSLLTRHCPDLTNNIYLPSGMMAQQLCIWKVKVADYDKILFNFRLSPVNFSKGFEIRILDGENCASKLIYLIRHEIENRFTSVVSSNNEAVIIFKSPAGINLFSGVFINVSTVHGNPNLLVKKNVCHQYIKGNNNGTFGTTKKLRLLKLHQFCTFQVTISSELMMMVKIVQLKIPLDGTNFVVLFDGGDCMSKRIAVTNQKTIEPLITSGHQVSALLITNDVLDKRFTAIYQSVGLAHLKKSEKRNNLASRYMILGLTQQSCGEEIYCEECFLHIPSCTASQMLCIWRVNVMTSFVIKVFVTIKQGLQNQGWIRVLDGNGCDKPELMYITLGKKNMKLTNLSTSNQVVVVYFQLGFTKYNGLVEIKFQQMFFKTTVKQDFRLENKSTKSSIKTTSSHSGSSQPISLLSDFVLYFVFVLFIEFL